MDLFVVVDQTLATRLGQDDEIIDAYVRKIVDEISRILGQLVPPGSINLIGVKISREENEPFSVLWSNKKVKGVDALVAFVAYARRHINMWKADFLLWLTGRGLARVSEDHSIEGMTTRGQVCGPGKAAIISAREDGFNVSLTAAHEISHALGAYHDGAGSSKSCPPTDNYLMHPHAGGVGPTYSSCALQSINIFLK
ncbi:metalloprotease mig-17-like [Rhipicephalus sanguineus]|uniref:metalloprotease mig-17-like n=1 Tax=Rhipicephalus sanguineus TaxID=34632 RepID=UPI0020C316A7|nr:metalloprotease mig-17-like [Rhipicephalus sanguineus]